MERFLAFLYLEAEGFEHVPAREDPEALSPDMHVAPNGAHRPAARPKRHLRNLDLRAWLLGARG